MFSEVNIRMFQVSRMKNWPLKQAHPSGQKIPAQSDRYKWIKLDMCILCSGILRVERHCLQCQSHLSLLGILYIYQRSKKIAWRRLVSLYFTWQMCPAASEHPNPVGVQLFGREFFFHTLKIVDHDLFLQKMALDQFVNAVQTLSSQVDNDINF